MPTMRRVIVGADTNAATHHYRNNNYHVQHHGKEEQIVVERAGSSNIVEASTPKVRIDQRHATAGAEKYDLTLNCYAQQRRPAEVGAPDTTVNMMISTASPLAPPLRVSTSERVSLPPGTSPSDEHQYYHVEPQLHFLAGNNDRLLYSNALPQQKIHRGEIMYTDCYDDTATADILNTGRVHPTMTNVSTVPMISEMTRNSFINNLVREQTLIVGAAPQVLTLPSNLVPQQIPATNVDGSSPLFFGQGTNDIIFAQKLPACVYPIAGQQEENEISFSNYPINNTGKRDNMPATAYHHDLVVGRPPYSFDRRQQSHQVAVDSSAADGASKKDEPEEQPITYYQSRHPLNAYNYFFSEEREIILTELKFALQKAGTKAADLSDEQILNILDSPPILPPEIQKDLDHRIKTKARETLEMRKSGQSRAKPPRRKSHGLVGFHSLSKAIGKRWRNLPKSSKRMAYFKQLAKEEVDLYKKIKQASRVEGR